MFPGSYNTGIIHFDHFFIIDIGKIIEYIWSIIFENINITHSKSESGEIR